MERKRLLYFVLLGGAVTLFGLAALLTMCGDGDGDMALLRFVVVGLAMGSTAGAWLTAVTIATVHRKSWPLFLTAAAVVTAVLLFLNAVRT